MAHPRLRAPVGRGETPLVVALLALEVDGRVCRPVVRLLVHDEPFAACLDEATVGRGVPHLDLDRERGDFGGEGAHALDQIVLRHESGVLTRNQEQVAKTASLQLPRLVEQLGR